MHDTIVINSEDNTNLQNITATDSVTIAKANEIVTTLNEIENKP